MARDDWTMSLLADRGAYRGAYPEAQWPASPAASQPGPPAAFGDYLDVLPQQPADRLVPLPESPAGAIYGVAGRAGGAVARGVGHAIGDIADIRGYRQNPHVPGTEEWQFAENVKADKAPIWAAETAQTLAGGGAPAAVKGAAGIFGGRLSATADLKALSRAEAMATAGQDAQKIWDATGWFQGADRKWRYEIPDVASKMKKGKLPEFGTQTPLAEHFNHPELFAAYPQLMKLGARRMSPQYAEWMGMQGGYSPAQGLFYNPAKGTENSRNILLHELQHAVQRIEDYAKGGGVEGSGKKAVENYLRLAGEPEARNVQFRRDFAGSQLKIPPWVTHEYPYDKQIVQYYSFPRKRSKMSDIAAQDKYGE